MEKRTEKCSEVTTKEQRQGVNIGLEFKHYCSLKILPDLPLECKLGHL